MIIIRSSSTSRLNFFLSFVQTPEFLLKFFRPHVKPAQSLLQILHLVREFQQPHVHLLLCLAVALK